MPTTLNEKDAVLAAANMLRSMGASQVFVFGSLVRGELRPDSDIDMAVSGLPAKVYFSAVSRASDLLGRPLIFWTSMMTRPSFGISFAAES